MFVNYSNHPSAFWGDLQKKEAEKWGELKDLPFPSVDPEAEEEDIEKIAEKEVEKICGMKPRAVLCQGEFTLAFSVITKLKKRGITVVAACSKREAIEQVIRGNEVKKESIFLFVKFREYQV